MSNHFNSNFIYFVLSSSIQFHNFAKPLNFTMFALFLEWFPSLALKRTTTERMYVSNLGNLTKSVNSEFFLDCHYLTSFASSFLFLIPFPLKPTPTLEGMVSLCIVLLLKIVLLQCIFKYGWAIWTKGVIYIFRLIGDERLSGQKRAHHVALIDLK